MATRTISTKLAVEGESQYKQAIKNINSELSTLDSRLKLVQSEFVGQQNSMEALRAKAKALSEVQAAQAEKVKTLKEAYHNAKSALEEYASKSENLKRELSQNEEALSRLSDETKSAGAQWNDYKQKLAETESRLKELKNATGDTADEQDELEKEITETKAAMARLERETDGAASAAGDLLRENKELNSELHTNEAYLDSAQRATNNWERQLNTAQVRLNQTNAEIEKNEKYLDEAAKSADGCATSIDGMGKEAKEAGDTGKKAFGDLYQAVTALGLIEGVKKLAEGMKSCVDAAAEFEYQMATVKSLSGATGSEFEELSNRAKMLGATTSFTATQAGEAMEYMALAGWNSKEMLEGVDGVMALAAAATMDLGTASDIVTDNLTAFGLAAKDSNRFADQMAYAMSKSNTTVEQLGESYKYCAATSTQLGYSLEDTTAALMVMANAGIKGSSSGTALASIMTRLGNDVSDCRKMLEGYGIQVYDTTGSVRDLSAILDDMKGIWGKLTDEEKSALAYTVAGKTAQAQLMTVLGESTGAFEEYTEGLRNCNGAAKEMQDIKLETFTGKVQLLGSAYDGLRVSIGEDLMPVLGMLVEGLTDVLTAANRLVEAHPGITAAIVGVTTALAAFAVGAVATSGVVTETLIPALMAAFSNPVVLAVAAIGALVAALVTLRQNIQDTDAEGQMWSATRKMREEAEELIGTIRAEQEAFEELAAGLEQTARSGGSMVEELNELREKSELTASEQERMLYIVEKLNEDFPELGLAYDQATNSLNMSTEAVRNFVEASAEEELASEMAARYNTVLDERAEVSSKLKEAQEALKEAEGQLTEAQAEAESKIFVWNNAVRDAEASCRNAQAAVDELRQADADLAQEEETLRESIDAANAQMGETDGVSQAAASSIDLMIAQMESLNAAYLEEYDAAYKSIAGQFNLWDELDTVVATSAEDIRAALESQTEYWTNYADNLENLNGRNIEGLNAFVAAVDDGSTNAAAYIAGLADMSDEELRVLVEQTYPDLIEAQSRAAEGSAEMATSYSENINEMATDTAEAIKAMNLSEEAKQAASDTLQGYKNGLDSSFVTKRMEEVANEATSSFKNVLGVHSPSTVFKEVGNNTMQGYAEGVSNNKQLVVKEMQEIAKQITEIAKTALGAPVFQEIGKITMTGLKNGISMYKADTVRTMTSAADEIVNTTKTTLRMAVFQEIGAGIMTGLKNGISSGRVGVVNEMKTTANAIHNEAKSGLSTDKFKTIGSGTMTGLKSGISSGRTAVVNEMKTAASKIHDEAKSGLSSDKFKTIGSGAMTGLKSGISSGRTAAVNEMKTAASKIHDEAKSGLSSSKFESIGSSAIEGIKKGIENGIPSLTEAAKKAAKAAYDAAKKELEVNSPSKKFEYLGEMSVEGYTGGWKKHSGDIDRLVEKELETGYRPEGMQNTGAWGEKAPPIINQVIHIHSKTDSIVEAARRFEESQREAATAW